MKAQTLQPTVDLKSLYKAVFVLGAFLAPSTVLAERIISLAPSITETIYALGAGEQLVGVTNYCDFPEAAKKLPKVGGLYNPNLEVIVELKPSLVIATPELKLPQGNFEVLNIPQESLEDIIQASIIIGKRLGLEAQGKTIASDIRTRLTALSKKKTAKRALVVVGGHQNTNSVFIAGKNTFYSELLEALGSQNAYTGALEFPKVSSEGVLSMNPEVIIDIAPGEDKPAYKSQWASIPGLKAQIRVLTEEYLVNPGPRTPLIAERLAEALW